MKEKPMRRMMALVFMGLLLFACPIKLSANQTVVELTVEGEDQKTQETIQRIPQKKLAASDNGFVSSYSFPKTGESTSKGAAIAGGLIIGAVILFKKRKIKS